MNFISTTRKLSMQKTAVRCILLACAAVASTNLVMGDPLLVSEVVAKQNATNKVMPVLPPIARQTHLGGRVVIELSISEDGSVSDAKVLSGNPILGMAAAKAGKEWAFKPFMGGDGKPTQAIVKLTFDFEAR